MNTKKKILIRIGSLQSGGAEKVLCTYLNLLSFNDVDVHVLLNSKRGAFISEVPEWVHLKWIVLGDDQLEHLNKFNYLLYKAYRRAKAEVYNAFPRLLYGRIIDSSYDVEMAFSHELIPHILQSPNKKSKKIGWVHSDYSAYKKNYSKEQFNKINAAFLKSDDVICVSKNAEESVHAIEPKLYNKTKVIYNPLEVNSIRKLAEKQPHYLQDSPTFKVLQVGRLEEVKGVGLLLEAFLNLKAESFFNKLELHFIGEGKYQANLLKEIAREKVENQVFVHPFSSNPYSEMNKANLIALCSYSEGFSLVLAEALILNKSIISTDTAGPRELLKNGALGKLVSINAKEIANGIKSEFLLHEKRLPISLTLCDLPFNAEKSINKFKRILEQE